MKASCVHGFVGVCFLPQRAFPVQRLLPDWTVDLNRVSFPPKVSNSPAKYAIGVSGIDGSLTLKAVPPTLLAAEKEEAKAVLTLFLKKLGLSKAASARIINKSDLFIDHLVSRIHYVHKSRYLVGRELTTLEIREALVPYLESLLEEYGNSFVAMVDNYPQPPIKRRSSIQVSSPLVTVEPKKVTDSTINHKKVDDCTVHHKKVKALARLSPAIPEDLPQHVIYLIELGMDLEKIQEITRKFPSFAYYSLDGKVKPMVEFLLDLGVPKSDVSTILARRPQLCGISLTENMIPTMKFLEDVGVDKNKWAKVIYRFPALLTYSRQKLISTIDFLYEMGLRGESIGKLLTRCPNIISYSVEEKLRPVADYFISLGVDVSIILHRSPQTFGLSIETNLKPITEFFLEKGYSSENVGTMIQRYGVLYTFSLEKNLMPKWEYFLTMEYPPIELVKFPQYFGYSLENRIKPRYDAVKQAGVKLLLNQVLSLSDTEFNKVLDRKLKKLNDAN